MTSSRSTPETNPGVRAEIRVPHETVNDDTVTVQQWHAEHGTPIRAGQLIVSIETSKAVLEVEATHDGFLEIISPRAAEVPIGALIGRVLASAPSAAAAPRPAEAAKNGTHAPAPARSSNRLRDRATKAASSESTPQPPKSASASKTTSHDLPAPTAPAAPAISKKAQSLIDEHHIDAASAFAGMGLIREADVLRHLGVASPEMPATAATSAPRSATAPNPAPPAAYTKKKAGLFSDAAVSARERGGRSVLWLAWNYFWRNWFLGNLVKVAPRGVNLTLHRWRGVKLGQGVFIDPTAIVETAYPENITIGNDVRVTAGCVIMTHIKAPHYLRDSGLVPNTVKPVVLEDHSFIGVNSVIMPGVTVGRATVVASGSVVVSNVPPYTMVQGNPAKVIKHFPQP